MQFKTENGQFWCYIIKHSFFALCVCVVYHFVVKLLLLLNVSISQYHIFFGGGATTTTTTTTQRAFGKGCILCTYPRIYDFF